MFISSNDFSGGENMSQELMGTCGAAVGSSEYFHLLNQGKIFALFMAQDGY